MKWIAGYEQSTCNLFVCDYKGNRTWRWNKLTKHVKLIHPETQRFFSQRNTKNMFFLGG